MKLKHDSRHNNLSKKEKQALHELKNNTNIIIKKCDKGGGIAILNREDYIHKIDEMLMDHNTYQLTTESRIIQQKHKSDDMIKYALQRKGGITTNQLSNIKKRKVTTPHFYGIVKIHKKDHPLRPIISQIDSPTSEINDIVDHYLEIAMNHIPEILVDTTDFLNRINSLNNLTEDTILITADITSLYTNIPQKEGAKWVSEFYDETLKFWTTKDKEQNIYLAPLKMKEMIIHILKSATFEFNERLYKQLHGTTMGAQFSVKYAQIYMHMWIRAFRKEHPEEIFNTYLRFIDDIFATTDKNQTELNTYMDKLNNFHPNIKWQFESSRTEVHFLDVKVYKKNNKLETTIFTKPTDRKKYLHYKSAHTRPNKTGIPKSQLIRLRRIISDDEELEKQIDILKNKFLEREYPIGLIEKAITEVLKINRSETLQKRSTNYKQDKFNEYLKGKPFLPFITTFYPWLENKKFSLRRSMEKIFTSIITDLNQHTDKSIEMDDTYKVFKDCMPQIVYAKAKCLADILTRSKLQSTKEDEEVIYTLAYLLQTADD